VPIPSASRTIADDGGARSPEDVPVVSLRGIVKRFGSVVANDGADLDVAAGEIHALLGENGAGKTTLMNVLFGMFQPDEGDVLIRGERVRLKSPRDALARRVGMVHQHFMLVPDFTVAENVVLGTQRAGGLRLRRAAIERDVAAVAERHGMRVDPARPVSELSIDAQQRVEILKLLHAGADVLILDEPTAVLGPAEVEALFATLRGLARAGATVIVITHKLREVLAIADRVTVLRHGRVVAQAARGELDEHRLAVAMLGHELPSMPSPATAAGERRAVLHVEGLHVLGDREETAVAGVDLELRSGEIVGLAGVEGNGQVELCQALTGLRAPVAGRIRLGDTDLTGAGPAAFSDAGIGVISDDRHRWDVVPDMTVAENLALTAVRAGRYSRRGFLRRGEMRRDAERLLEEYDVRPRDPDALLGTLSGGNQQKVVVARECAAEPSVLIAAHPTRGLDVGASEFVLRRIAALSEAGCAVLLVSSDLDELRSMADRLVVLFRGEVVLDEPTAAVDVQAIAVAMSGGTR